MKCQAEDRPDQDVVGRESRPGYLVPILPMQLLFFWLPGIQFSNAGLYIKDWGVQGQATSRLPGPWGRPFNLEGEGVAG